MALTLFEKDLDIIQKLDNQPNAVGGLGADQFKAKFDEAGNIIKEYINKSLIPEIESDIDTASQGISPGGGIDGNKLLDGTVGGEKIKKGSLKTELYEDGSITTPKYAKGSVTREILAEDAKTLETTDFPNKVVPQRALDDNAVSTIKLEDGSVTTAKIKKGAVNFELRGTLFADAWEDYQQSVSLSGLLPDDICRLDLDTGSIYDKSEMEALDELWHPLKAEAGADLLTVIFSEVPNVDLPIKVAVARR